MRDYLLLVKLWVLSVLAHTGVGGKQILKAVGLGALIVYGFGTIMALVYISLYALFGISPAASAHGILAGMIAVLQVFGAMFALKSMMGVMGSARDLPFLLSLPLSPRALFAARLTRAYPGALLMQGLFLLPAFAAYVAAYGAYASIAPAALFLLISPVVPAFIAALLTLLITRVSGVSRNAERMMTVIGLIATLGIVAVTQLINGTARGGFTPEQIAGIAQSAEEVTRMATRVFPPAMWAARGVLGPSPAFLLLYALLCALLLAVIVLIGGKLYAKGALSASEGAPRVKRGRVSYARGGVLRAFAIRDARVILRSPLYAMNALSGALIVPVMLVFSLSSSGALTLIMGMLTESTLFMGALGVMAFVCLVDPAASTAHSREGKCAWLLGAMPVKPFTQYIGKVIPGLALSFAGCALIAIAGCVVFPAYAAAAILAAVAGCALAVPMTILGALPDALHPKLNWSTEQEAMKQNVNSLWGMLLPLPVALPHIVPLVLLGGSLYPLAALASVAISAIETAILLRVLPAPVERAYARLQGG